MHLHSHKFNSEDDVRSQKSHYTNVSKRDSAHLKNVELSLEVELDDEVRNIIKHPEKCPSALLDVTVIKPKGLDRYSTKTQILKSDQVRKLIESMKLDSTDKKILMDKLFGIGDFSENDSKQQKELSMSHMESKKKTCFSGKSTKQVFHQSSIQLKQGDIHCLVDEKNSAVYSMYNEKPLVKETPTPKAQQIYTTPRTYENIRSMFACKNKEKEDHENDKMDQPCLCQNCAIVGIITDSQKKPFATEPIPNPMEENESKFRRPSRKKSVTFKHLEDLASASGSHAQCQAIFKLLSARISDLEKRIILQEEKAVPKDYFKKIITKLVNHLSKLTHYTTEERNLTTSHRQKDAIPPYSKHKPNDRYNRYYVNPVLMSNNYKVPAEKEYDPKECSSSDQPRGPTESFWKWGEEFLHSGRDLKNKVVLLLEDTLHNLKKGWDKSQNHHGYDEDLQSIVDELSKNLAQTVKMSSPRNKDPKYNPVLLGRPRNSSMGIASGSAKQKLVGDKKNRKPSKIPRFKGKKGTAVNVAYINPQLTRWPEESSVSFKIDTSDYDSHRENMNEAKKKQYRREFLKVLENTKTTDKYKLWQNIWNQALENRQTKNDTVTIQIPDPKDLLRQKMIHLEYTIGELEHLLITSQNHPKTKK